MQSARKVHYSPDAFKSHDQIKSQTNENKEKAKSIYKKLLPKEDNTQITEVNDSYGLNININQFNTQTPSSGISQKFQIVLHDNSNKQKKVKKKSLKLSKKDLFYEKLSSTSKPYYTQVAQLMKEIDEKKNCTFQPDINDKGQRFQDIQQLFEKLHSESNFKNKQHEEREKMRLYKEMRGCTFQPKPSQSPVKEKGQPESSIYERLYQNYKELNLKRLHMQQQKEEQINEGLTFTPHISHNSNAIDSAKQQNAKEAKEEEKQILSPSFYNRFEKLYQDSVEKSTRIKERQEQR